MTEDIKEKASLNNTQDNLNKTNVSLQSKKDALATATEIFQTKERDLVT